MINKENEKKIILTEEEYLNINSKFEKIEEKNQINYYFDTQNYGLANNDETLRVLNDYIYICFSDMSEVAFAKRIFYMVYCCFNVFDLEDKTGN